MRVGRGSRRRQTDLLEQSSDPRVRLALGDVVVQQDRLRDLSADALHGVERVHRALEDDRRARPAHRAQPPPPHREHVVALEQDLPRRVRAPRQQPQHGEREGGLAAAGLSGDAELLPSREREVDASDGRNVSARRAVDDF